MKNGALFLTDGEFWKVECGARWHIALDSGAPLAADNFQPPNFSKTSQKCPFSRSPRFARLFRTQANFVLCLACDYRTQANLLLRLACDFERKPICFLAWLAFNRGQAERAAQASKIGLLSADLCPWVAFLGLGSKNYFVFVFFDSEWKKITICFLNLISWTFRYKSRCAQNLFVSSRIFHS